MLPKPPLLQGALSVATGQCRARDQPPHPLLCCWLQAGGPDPLHVSSVGAELGEGAITPAICSFAPTQTGAWEKHMGDRRCRPEGRRGKGLKRKGPGSGSTATCAS